MSVMVSGNGNVPTQSEIEIWTGDHSLTHPVLNDASMSQSPYVTTGFPTYVVIDRTMTIQNADMWPWDSNYVLQLL
jgi:hypothetical protein